MRKTSPNIHNIHLRFNLNDPKEVRICEAIRGAKNQTQYVMQCVDHFLLNPPPQSLAEQIKKISKRIELLEQRRIPEAMSDSYHSDEQMKAESEEAAREEILEFLSRIPGCG